MDVRIGILFGEKTGNAILDIKIGDTQKRMSVPEALKLAKAIENTAHEALQEETLAKFVTSKGFKPEDVAELIGGFREIKKRSV